MSQGQLQPAGAGHESIKSPENSGFMSSIANFANEHPGVALGMTGGALAGISLIATEAVSAAPVDGGKTPAPKVGKQNPGQSNGEASASNAGATANASSVFEWEHVGGDPFVDGGVQNKDQLERAMKSGRGREALRDQGLNGREIRKVIDAVDDSDGDRDVRNCKLKRGDRFDTMVFGDSGVIASNVKYTGSPEDAYCVNVKMPNGKVIKIEIPKACGNIAIDSMMKRPPKRHRRVAPVFLDKVAEDANGNLMRRTPTGIFLFDAKCRRGNKWVVREDVVFQHPRQRILACNIGARAIVKEVGYRGKHEWQTLGPAKQRRRVSRRAKNNIFVFKNGQARPNIIPTTIPVNHPPTGIARPPMHRYPNSEGPVCVDDISDPDGDAVTASNFDFENVNGQDTGQVLGGVFTMPGSDGGTQCVRWKAPSNPMQVSFSAELSDGRGGESEVMDNFPVIPLQL